MKSSTALTGNSGPKIRSDCEVRLELTGSGGIIINLESKVGSLYGNSIAAQIRDELGFYGINNATVEIRDSGALPFVIAARLEAAVRQLTGTTDEYLPDFISENLYSTARDRSRTTRLYLPGNTPSLMINAGLHSPDGIILDLEDSVSPEKKDEARVLVRNALRQADFRGAERMVRINQGDRAFEDLKFVIPHNVNLILVPKCESADNIRTVENWISQIGKQAGIKTAIYLMPVIESARGVENAFSIACSSELIVAMAIGLEDYTADIGVQRTNEGKESLYARTRIVNAAKAAGIQAIDSVFSDIDDMDALKESVRVSKSLGFDGMGCIHPRQIPVIKDGFAPSDEEIERAKKIILAFEEAKMKGSGVICLGSKMIDAPVVERAKRTVSRAVMLNIIREDWKDVEMN